MATTVATLNTVVTANAIQHINELNKAAKATHAFGRGVKTALGALGLGFSIGGVIAYGKEILDLGGQITDLSRVAGLGTTQFQTLANVGMASGVSMEEIAKASESMRSHIQEAADGSKPMIETFSKLNLTAEGLQALAPEKQWEVIAQRVAMAADKQEALNAVSDIYGAKLGPKMREVLDVIAEGFDKAGAATAALSFTPEQLKSLDDAGDKLAELWKMAKVQGAKAVLGVGGISDELTKGLKEQAEKNEMDAMVTPKKGWWAQRWENFAGKINSGPSSMEDPMHGRGFMPLEAQADGKGTESNPVVVSLDASTEATMKAAAEAKIQAGALSPAKLRAMDREELATKDLTPMGIQAALSAAEAPIKEGQFEAPRSDSLQRLGMLTGAKADEPEKQTNLLKGIHLVLTQIYRDKASGNGMKWGD